MRLARLKCELDGSWVIMHEVHYPQPFGWELRSYKAFISLLFQNRSSTIESDNKGIWTKIAVGADRTR